MAGPDDSLQPGIDDVVASVWSQRVCLRMSVNSVRCHTAHTTVERPDSSLATVARQSASKPKFKRLCGGTLEASTCAASTKRQTLTTPHSLKHQAHGNLSDVSNIALLMYVRPSDHTSHKAAAGRFAGCVFTPLHDSLLTD